MSNRGPIEHDNTVSAVAFTPPILWIQIVTAGSGGLVVKDEGGTSRTLSGLLSGEVIAGPFTEITSTTCTKIRAGDALPIPAPAPASALLGSTVAGNGADAIGYPDASSKTAETTTGGAIDELFVGVLSAQKTIPIPLASGILAAGTPLAAWANNASSNPGITLADSKAVGVRWNDNTTTVAVWYNVALPQDLDDTAPIVLHALVSKSGATLADATTLTVTAFFQTAGALHDADTDCGGVSSAIVGDLTAKTVTEVTLSIAHADVPPAPCALSFSIKPTGAVTTTDDVIVSGLWFEYTPKLLAS